MSRFEVCVCPQSQCLCSICFCFVHFAKTTTSTITYAIYASTLWLSWETTFNTAIANLHSLHLCYMCLPKKMTSMSPSPTYTLFASALCTSLGKCYQHRHRHHCSSHESNWLFLTLNQFFFYFLCLHVGLLLAIENESFFCLVCIPTSLLPKVFIRIWSTQCVMKEMLDHIFNLDLELFWYMQ